MPWHEGDVVHKLRRLAGLNVTQLAERAKLNTSQIYRLEQGITKAEGDTIEKLAIVFGLSKGDLMNLVPRGFSVPRPHLQKLMEATRHEIERAHPPRQVSKKIHKAAPAK